MTTSRRVEPSERPFVLMNVASGIDGKIAPIGDGQVTFGGAEDRALMEDLRAGVDAVMIGGGTLRKEDPPLLIRDPTVRARRLATKGTPHPLNIAVVSSLPKELATMRFFREPETQKLLFTTDRTPPALVDKCRAFGRVEVVPADSDGHVDLTEVVRRLPTFDVQRLLLEGGGDLNFSMLRLGLIDEVYLTLCPFVFGGRTAPSAFGGDGFPKEEVRKLSLKEHRVGSKGVIFLRYDVLFETALLTDSPSGQGFLLA